MKKRLLTLIISLAVIISFMPVTGYAFQGWQVKTNEGYFRIKDGETADLTITVDISGVTDVESPEFQYEWTLADTNAFVTSGVLNEANNYTYTYTTDEPGVYVVDVQDISGSSHTCWFNVDKYVEPHVVGGTLWLGSEFYHAVEFVGDMSDNYRLLDITSSDPDVIGFYFYDFYGQNIFGYHMEPYKVGTSTITLHYTDENGTEKYESADFVVKPYPEFADFTVDGETFDSGMHYDGYSVVQYTGTEPSVKISPRPGWSVDEAYYYVFNDEDSDSPETTIWFEEEDFEKENILTFPEDTYRLFMNLDFVNEDGETIRYYIDLTRGSTPYSINGGSGDDINENDDPTGSHTHTPELVGAVEATCTAKGYTGDTVCSECGETLEKGSATAALGHKKISVKAVAATCQATGMKTHYECERCGTFLDKKGKVLSAKAKKKLVVKKKAHSYKKKISTEEYLKSNATCTKKTTYYYACSMCGLKGKKTYTVGKALGHSYENVLTPATPTKDGKIVKTCTRCGKKAKTTKIYKASKVTIDKKYQTVAYKGDNAETTTVSVKTSKKKAISKNYYDLTFDNDYETGIGTVTVTFKGNYSGTKTLTYKIKGIPQPEPQEEADSAD